MKPYYQDKYIAIYYGDCREILPDLPKVDLVLTSPPFNLGNNHHTGNTKHKAYDDNMPETAYQEWQVDILGLLYNIVNDEGSCWYQHKNRIRNGVMITPYKWILKTNWIIKQEIVWFNGSQNFDKRRFYPMTERLYWLAKRPSTQLINTINKHDDWHITPSGINKEHTRTFPDEIPNNIFACFPQALIILDPFLGSGITCYCAKKLSRKSIGIEIEEKYCEIAAKRCSQMVMEF